MEAKTISVQVALKHRSVSAEFEKFEKITAVTSSMLLLSDMALFLSLAKQLMIT